MTAAAERRDRINAGVAAARESRKSARLKLATTCIELNDLRKKVLANGGGMHTREGRLLNNVLIRMRSELDIIESLKQAELAMNGYFREEAGS